MRLAFVFCCALLVPLAAAAAEPAAPAPSAEPLPPPPLPGRDTSSTPPETGLEPEITITTRGDVTHHEYRLNGRLYMVKVIPKRGKPYYLIDDEGAGQFRRSDFEPNIAIPHWVIKSW